MEFPLQSVAGLFVAFAVLLFLLRRRVSYGLALIVSSTVFALFLSPWEAPRIFIKTLGSDATLNLAAVIALIAILFYVMEKTGEMKELIDELGALVKKTRALIVGIPAMMGVFPISGGALFSAQLIDGLTKKLKLQNHVASYINVWFRHLIYFIFPITPSLVLAAQLGEVSLYTLILIQTPMFLLSLLTAYFTAVKGIPLEKEKGDGNVKRFLFHLLPIITVIALNVLGVPLVLAFIAGILLSMAIRKVRPRNAVYLLYRGFGPNFVLAVVGIMFFRYTFEASPLSDAIKEVVPTLGLPPPLLFSTISFLFSLTIGHTLVSVGFMIPVFYSFCVRNPINVSLIYVSSFLGYLISPLHLCVVLTLEHFKADSKQFYRLLLPSVFIVWVFSILLLSFLQ